LGDVTTVGFGDGPAEGIFLLLRTLEELGGASEDGIDGFFRDTVVLEVDEPGILEAISDALRSGEFVLFRAVEEGGEVYEL